MWWEWARNMLNKSALDKLPAAIAAVAPRMTASEVETWTAALKAPMIKSAIITPYRMSMFLGQTSEETGGFSVLTEDLYYTTSARLIEVYGEVHFPTVASTVPYLRQPEKLANYVYANRLGNGPVSSGDGWRFRGGGLIEITGRDLYTECGKALGKTPAQMSDYMLTAEGAAASACWYWSLRNLNPLADVWNIRELTRIINGGLVNFPTRTLLCGDALHAVLA